MHMSKKYFQNLKISTKNLKYFNYAKNIKIQIIF
jgi:hypothetical protein